MGKIQYFIVLITFALTTGCFNIRGVDSSSASVDDLGGCDITLTPFGAGDGTLASPYLICSTDQLLNVTSHLSSHFKLMKDLDLTSVALNPIGADNTTGFSGVFDGNNHQLSHWSYSNVADAFAVGLFRRVDAGGVVKNLTLNAADIRGNAYVGGIAGLLYGYALNITIQSSTIKGQATTGGVAGQMMGTGSSTDKTIENASVKDSTVFSYATDSGFCDCAVGGIVGVVRSGGGGGTGGQVIHSSTENTNVTWDPSGPYQDWYMTYVGGIAGFTWGDGAGTTMVISNNTVVGGTVTGVNDVGGVVGASDHTTISDCKSSATVVGTRSVGGVAGIAHGPLLRTSASGNVTGVNEVGGLAGFHYANPISKSFSSGTVTATGSHVGGLIGRNNFDLSDSYSFSIVVGAVANIGGVVGFSDGGTLSNLYSLSNSITSTGAGVPRGVMGSITAGTISNSYYLDTLPADGNASALTSAQTLLQASYTGFSFPGSWRMPSANPGHALSPVLEWQCDFNGVTCY